MNIRTRIAPAPTGRLHIGTAHTALFNYLFAKHHHGKFILRIDDSDAKRSNQEFEKDIIAGLKWLGIDWDEGPDIGGPYAPYRQSERINYYQPYIKKLLLQGKAYQCYCTSDELRKEREEMEKKRLPPMYSGKCRNLTASQKEKFRKQGKKPVLRLKVRPGMVKFEDPTRGTVEVDSKTIGDFVLVRSDGSPLLVFTTTVDDIEMKITHTIRGEDFLNLVPRQILLFEALEEKPPIFAHLQFIYGPDGTKLSKRHGAKSVLEYRDDGYLKEALITFMAYLGWSYQDNSQPLSMIQLIKLFNLEKTRTGKPIFDIEKLRWFNGLLIRKKNAQELHELLSPYLPEQTNKRYVEKIITLIKDRIHVLNEFEMLTGFFFKKPHFKKQVILDQSKHGEDETRKKLEEVSKRLAIISQKEFNTRTIEESLRILLEDDWSTKELFMTIRVVISGKTVSPPLFETIEVLGKKETLERINYAIKKLEKNN